MMKGRRSTGSTTFLFIIFFLSAVHHGLLHVCANGDLTMRLPLVHKYSPHFKGGLSLINKTDIDIMKELHQHDIVRRQAILQRRNRDGHQIPRRKDIETSRSSSLAMPVHSGFDILSGLYWVDVKIGTPPKTMFLVADTGSDLTWVNCKYNATVTKEVQQKLLDEARRNHHADDKKRSHFLKRGRVFRGELSSTFTPIRCSDGLCNKELELMQSLPHCPTPVSPCRYNYSYMGGNSAEGFFGYDVVTVPLLNGGKTHLPKMLIGCTESSYRFGDGDGVLGLGFGDYSFPETVVATKVATKFSYCLMNHRTNSSVLSYLTFGPNKQAFTVPMRYTELVMMDARQIKTGNYGAKLAGISVGGTLLKIPSQIWDEMWSRGGLVVDSGSTNTWLVPPIYKAVMDELIKALSKYQKIKIDALPFEFCFIDKGYNESLVPRVALHFTDGVKFEPPVKNYVLIVREGVRCLGFVPAFDGMCVLGNQMQSNYIWEFDILGSKLGFAPSGCT